MNKQESKENVEREVNIINVCPRGFPSFFTIPSYFYGWLVEVAKQVQPLRPARKSASQKLD